MYLSWKFGEDGFNTFWDNRSQRGPLKKKVTSAHLIAFGVPCRGRPGELNYLVYILFVVMDMFTSVHFCRRFMAMWIVVCDWIEIVLYNILHWNLLCTVSVGLCNWRYHDNDSSFVYDCVGWSKSTALCCRQRPRWCSHVHCWLSAAVQH